MSTPPSDPGAAQGWDVPPATPPGPASAPAESQQWGGQGAGYGYGQARDHAPGAVGSLVCGILGLFTIPLVLSIIAVVLGNQSKRAAAAEPHRYTDQLGQVGRILGWIGIGLAALGLLFLLAVIAFVFPLRS